MRNSSNFARLSGLLLIGVLMLLLSIQGVNVQAGVPAQATSAATGATGGTGTGGTNAGGAAATQGAGGMMRFPACTPARMFGTGAGAAATQSAGNVAATQAAGGMMATQNAGGMAATQSAGSATGTGTAYLGIRAAAVDSCGIQVAEVFASSPAAAAGLMVDDVIVAVDGQALPTVLMNNMNTGAGGTGTGGAAATQGAGTSGGAVATRAAGGAGAAATITPGALVTEFFRLVNQIHKPGDMLTLTIQRGGSEMDVPVTLAALSGSTGAGGTGTGTGGTTGAGGAAATTTP